MTYLTGDDILRQLAEQNAAYNGGPINVSQLNYMPWQQLPGINDFYMNVPAGGNPLDGTIRQGVFSYDPGMGSMGGGVVNPEVLAAYFKQNGYSLGQEFGPQSDVRWIQDANGNMVIEPQNYYTDDRTAALIGMGLLGGMLGTAVGAGVGVADAAGVGAGYGTGSAAFGDAAVAAGGAGTAAGGAGSVASTEPAGGGMTAGGGGNAGMTAPSGWTGEGIGVEAAGVGEGLVVAPESLYAPSGWAAGSQSALIGTSLADAAQGVGSATDVVSNGVTKNATPTDPPAKTQWPEWTPDWLKTMDPELAKLLFTGAGGLLSQVGGDDNGGGGYVDSGYRPTISRDGWNANPQAQQRGLLTPQVALPGGRFGLLGGR